MQKDSSLSANSHERVEADAPNPEFPLCALQYPANCIFQKEYDEINTNTHEKKVPASDT